MLETKNKEKVFCLKNFLDWNALLFQSSLKLKAELHKAEFLLSYPLTNAMKVLQACTYTSVKRGLFLKSIVAPRIVKFKILIPVFTFKFLWEKNMIILN